MLLWYLLALPKANCLIFMYKIIPRCRLVEVPVEINCGSRRTSEATVWWMFVFKYKLSTFVDEELFSYIKLNTRSNTQIIPCNLIWATARTIKIVFSGRFATSSRQTIEFYIIYLKDTHVHTISILLEVSVTNSAIAS
jgi:hypothetical protein